MEVKEEARVVFECLVLVNGKLLLLFSETGGRGRNMLGKRALEGRKSTFSSEVLNLIIL